MGELKMPRKGGSATMLQELNAEHAQPPTMLQETNVTRLQDYHQSSNEPTKPLSLEEMPQETVEEMPQETVFTDKQEGKKTHNERTKAEPPAARRATKAASEPHRVPERSVPEREERLAQAMQLAQEEEPAVVTIRVSPRLNAYIDRYVQRINQIEPKRRYRKQDAVAEAFAAFYADHPMPPSPLDENGL